jgi:hypothetical protein
MLVLSFIKQTGGAHDYWTSFFPGVLVFGFGMSLTVAPLTAPVMGSVGDHFSGTASGVNNAVSRIAGVFANAVFGALAVVFFTIALKHNSEALALTGEQKHVIMMQAGELGNAQVPKIIAAGQKGMVVKAYHDSFIAMYALLMKIGACLAFAGALMAALFIRKAKKNS